MNVKISLLALLLSFGAQANLATYKLDDWITVNDCAHRSDILLTNNFFSIRLGNCEMGEYLKEDAKPLREHYYANYYKSDKEDLLRKGEVTDCTKKARSNGLFSKTDVVYSCFQVKKYNAEMKIYNESMKKYTDFKESTVTVGFNELTNSLGKISFDVTLKGEAMVSEIYSGKDEIQYMGVAKVSKCMDQYGEWFSADQSTGADSTIERLVNDLMSNETREYIRCSLKVESLTSKFMEINPVNKYVTNRFEVSKEVDNLVVEPINTYIGEDGTYHTFYPLGKSYQKVIYSRDDNSNKTAETSTLLAAVNEYVDFIRFEYGLVLSEIATSEMPKAQAQLKVQKFLLSNKPRIKAMLAKVTDNLKGNDFVDQVAVSFTIARVYQSVAELEGKLATVLKLDHIVK